MLSFITESKPGICLNLFKQVISTNMLCILSPQAHEVVRDLYDQYGMVSAPIKKCFEAVGCSWEKSKRIMGG